MQRRTTAQNRRNPAFVAVLLEGGADSNARNKQGATALHLAAKIGRSPAIVAALLERGADPNARSGRGTTPLHFAVRHNGNTAIAAALLKAGADPDARSKGGLTPLHAAAALNSDAAGIITLVQAGSDTDARDKSGWTALHLAASRNKNPEVVAALVKAGADPDARNGQKATPLHIAARFSGNPAVVAALLNAGADPVAISLGKTPFELATRNRKLAGSAAYRRLKDAHDKSAAARQAARQRANAKARTRVADDTAREPVSWRGSCSVGKDLKPGQGCRIPGGGLFRVAADGCVRSVPDIPGKVSMSKLSMSIRDGKSSICIRGHVGKGNFTARYRAAEAIWRIEALP